MKPHTTHHDDCGCLREWLEAAENSRDHYQAEAERLRAQNAVLRAECSLWRRRHGGDVWGPTVALQSALAATDREGALDE